MQVAGTRNARPERGGMVRVSTGVRGLEAIRAYNVLRGWRGELAEVEKYAGRGG